jgi:hypothetical protein
LAGQIQLIVRGDDFGMCHAVNAGIVQAFEEGILTQSSVMVPCPWFTESAALAKAHAIPVGVHQTLTCEWDFLRWRPLTSGRSLADTDGTFYRSVVEAREAIAHGDAVTELLAQASRFVAEGLEIEYLDIHMGAVAPSAYAEVSTQLHELFLYSDVAKSRGLASITGLSERDGGGKKEWLLSYLANLAPGVHMLVVHPAVGGPELASITGPSSGPYRWAEEYRVADLEVLLDPDVACAVVDRGIELTSVGKAIGRL